LVKAYSSQIGKSTRIIDYHLKDCVEGGFIKMKSTGRNIASPPFGCLRNRQKDPPWINGDYSQK
jgi:hypothetical protein